MRKFLEEETFSSSKDEEESRTDEKMCRQIVRIRQSLKEDRHYVLHDEMEMDALDQEGK